MSLLPDSRDHDLWCQEHWALTASCSSLTPEEKDPEGPEVGKGKRLKGREGPHKEQG